jgi:DNA polymerase-4
MQKVIVHLDMNSYFASVEQQDNPGWRGKPLGVCEHLGGIIIAASIEAKRWGIKTGTPVWEARKLYPKIILTKTNPDRYRLYIKRVIKVVSDYTNFVEQASIDEMYLDVSKYCSLKAVSGKRLGISRPFDEAVIIAKEIKRRMKIEVGDWLTCSIGIAENKLLAKIASDLQKPEGLVLVHNDSHCAQWESLCKVVSKEDLYQQLKLTDIPGIARRQEKNLNRLGIRTLLDLKNYPLSKLVARFGINGHHLHKMGQLEGSWKPAVEEDDVIKSIGHMYTLPREFREKKFFVPVLYKLCEMVAARLRKQGLMGNVIHFYVRDKDYNSFGESKSLGFCVYDGREIFVQCMLVFERLAIPKGVFKLIGVTVAGLRPYAAQLSLFGHEERIKRLSSTLDKINGKYGAFTVCRAPILAAKGAFQDSVGFGRIKEK